MADSPVVSVVVPCLNRAEFVRATLDSILSQGYPAIECIVMDGGSNDGTIDILRSYGDRIAWHSSPDGGPFNAINHGWDLSKGAILAWLNADDTWQPDAVETIVAFLRAHEDVDAVYGACGGIDVNGKLLWVEQPRLWDLDRAILRYDPVINQPACFLRRAIVDKVGGVTNDWCHDHDLWIKVGLAGGTIARVEEHLANCRVWSGDAHKNPKLMVPAVQRVVERAFSNPLLPARFQGKKQTAVSYAYVRCVQYLWFKSPAHWLVAAKLLFLAFRAKPAELPGILAEAAGRLSMLLRSVLAHARTRPARAS